MNRPEIIRTIIGETCVSHLRRALTRKNFQDLLDVKKGKVKRDHISPYYDIRTDEPALDYLFKKYVKKELVTINGVSYSQMNTISATMRNIERGTYISYNSLSSKNNQRVIIPGSELTVTLYFENKDWGDEKKYKVCPKIGKSFDLDTRDLLIFPDSECILITSDYDTLFFSIEYENKLEKIDSEEEADPKIPDYGIMVAMSSSMSEPSTFSFLL